MKEQNITVALRVRPINPREIRRGARPIARVVDKNLVVLLDPNRDSDDILRAKRCQDHSYMFDVAFSQRASQRDVYQRTSQGLVSKVISGYNATVFAYGPTGAGKTYTMLGRAGEPGIMALTLSDLFAKMEQNKATSRYRVTMAYLEIYNETVRNLLGPLSAGILDLREDAHRATVVSGLTELEVHDSEEVMALLTRGNLRRTCEPTAVNKTSSRSHAILRVTVEQQSRVVNISQKIRTGVLFMIDLAGSERAANTQNRGQRMKEGAHINRSLLALANCINTLSSGGQYVNYRDSKLTRLLKDALSGNCFTVMIAHISPASSCYEESKNTLKYADRVKHLKTKVSSNVVEVDQHVSEYQMCLESMKTRIHELERQLAWREGEGEGLCAELRTLLKEEKKIREEMVSLEYRLLLNAVERQKNTATIRLVGVASTPSPLPPSSLSPLPTTLEDTGQASLLFERLPNWFAEPSHMIEPSQSLEDIPAHQPSHMTTMETTQNDHMTTVDLAENSINSPDYHMATAESSHENHMTSPDSGQPVVEYVRTEEEEEEVSLARTELVRLQMERRRLEARHRRLGRKLMEIRTKKSQLQKRVFVSRGLHPHQLELCTALQLCGELEEEGRQRELAGAQASLQLGRREATLEGLLDLNHQLVAALRQYKTLLEERVVSSADRLPPLEPLFSRSSRLTWHAERERRLPVAGRALQLPTFSAFSARLCATASTTMAGSKSNLLVEDVTDGEGEEEDVIPPSGPDLSDGPLSSNSTSLPQDSLPIFSSASLLPPLPVTTSLTSPLSPHIPHDVIFPNPSMPAVLPLNQCQLCRSPPNEAPPNFSTTNAVPSSKRTSILSKVAFTTPRISISRSSGSKSKYVVDASLTDDAGDADAGKEPDTIATETTIGSEMLPVPPSILSETLPTSSADPAAVGGADAYSSPLPVGTAVAGGATEAESKEDQLQSVSQLSLTQSTQGRAKVEGVGRVGWKRARPRQSSIPVAKTTEQKTRREPLTVKAVDKPRQSLTVLPKRRQRERQTLVPSKVVAGGQVAASPYLKSTATGKFEAKKIVFKKTNPSHQVPKFKSPYHISMAKTNKTNK